MEIELRKNEYKNDRDEALDIIHDLVFLVETYFIAKDAKDGDEWHEDLNGLRNFAEESLRGVVPHLRIFMERVGMNLADSSNTMDEVFQQLGINQ